MLDKKYKVVGEGPFELDGVSHEVGAEITLNEETAQPHVDAGRLQLVEGQA